MRWECQGRIIISLHVEWTWLNVERYSNTISYTIPVSASLTIIAINSSYQKTPQIVTTFDGSGDDDGAE